MDTSSKKPNEPTCEVLDIKIHDVYLNVSDDKNISLASEADKDETLIAIKNQIIKGWPSQRGECP